MNDGKTVLGTTQEYFAAVAKLKFKQDAGAGYADPTAHPGLFDADDIHRIVWRLIWLLYISKDFDLDGDIEKRWKGLVRLLQQSDKLPPVCRIWAKSMPKFPSAEKWEKEIEDLHALDYVERGRQCYGA